MEFKKICIIAAQAILVIFFIYLVGLGISFPRMVENFEAGYNLDKEYSTLLQDNIKLKSDLKLPQNKTIIKKILDEIYEKTNLQMLESVLTHTTSSDKVKDKLDTLQKYKDTIGELEEFLNVKA